MDDLISRKRALEEMTFSSGIEQDGVLYVPLRDVNKHLKNLPSEAYLQTIATERYEDLCEYFGGREDPILTDRREFKRWLDRVRWHVKKVDELARRSEDEWCTDCPAYDHEEHNCPRYNRVIRETVEEIRNMEKPERKKGTWLQIIETNEFGEPYQAGVYCSRCGHQTVYEPNFCPNCGSYNGDKNEV